ncbi:TolC family protein [Robertkochia aurantiaca]|uniref:TolC family protein n=1 Tax=Robertkochia aurantiaca TaxID=2873700 RepID=UPI001CCA79A3|nr:TolC family protein [Robertkochia sp. 3YJGBD-33]
MRRHLAAIILSLFFLQGGNAQDSLSVNVLDLNEFLGFVKTYHPVARQADLIINTAQANLMQARGGFDPKVEVDYDKKAFKDSEYYDILNANFKIPTWFGIEFKAGYELNDGSFLNPQNTVPEDGLYSAGVSVPIGQGLFINERMATLKQAKIFQDLSQAQRDLELNRILFEATSAYIDWYRAYMETYLYQGFVENAFQRFQNVKTSAESGDIAPIDSVESRIAYRNRKISLEQARLDLIKARLKASNFLWIDEAIPLELRPDIIPDTLLLENLERTLEINDILPEGVNLENHPKLLAMRAKIDGLKVERRLKAEMLKPQLDLNYNFITSDATRINTINTGDYKFGLRFSMPLFLRKERGGLKIADFKIRDAGFEYEQQALELENKISASFQEVDNYKGQIVMVENVVEDYLTLLLAEERKFSFGESSIFLINSRERSYLDARLKEIDLNWKLAKAKASLFRNLAILP